MFAAHRDKMEYDGYAGPYNAFRVAPEDTQLVLDHPDIFSTYYYYPAALPRVYYKFAVEAVDALRRLGPIVLRYMLRAFDQKLSSLVIAMRDWADATGRTELPDAEFVEEFISARFGRGHHLTSLTRYAFQLPNGTNNDVATAAFDPDQQYQLHANVRLLADMHDCEALIKRIKEEMSADLFVEAEFVDRVTYVVTDAAAYRIEPDLQALLSLFEQPRSCREVTDLLAEVSGVDQLSSSYFAPLINAGILI
jgi:hypothetical protein